MQSGWQTSPGLLIDRVPLNWKISQHPEKHYPPRVVSVLPLFHREMLKEDD